MRPSNFVAAGWLCVSEQAAISEVIARQAAAGCGFRNAMYRAALAGDLRLMELLPGGTIPASMLAPREARPTLIVVNDDAAPVAPSPGPSGFLQARRLARWCSAVLLHAAGGEAWHYDVATEWTRTLRRVLLVETTTAREPEWREVLNAEAKRRERARQPALRGLNITVPRGGLHPAGDA